MKTLDLFFCGKIIPESILCRHYHELSNHVSLAGNTYFSSIISGLNDNGCNVFAISFFEKEKCEEYLSEYNGAINYLFFNRAHHRFVHYLHVMKVVVKEIFKFKNTEKKNQKAVLFSFLGYSYSVPGLLACKLLGLQTIAIITDVPGYRTKEATKGLLSKTGDLIGSVLIKYFDSYVFLSEAMKEIVDIGNKNSIVIEGIYKEPDALLNNIKMNYTNNSFSIMYAGSLDYEYGIMNLVNAVVSIKDDNVVLVIFGSGNAVEEIIKIARSRRNIIFKGRVTHEEVVCAERKVSLLVNPRPIEGEFVKYSFPSKVMEYMASGTPVLLTNIPSLPEEYKQYVNIVKDNTVEELKTAICKIAYGDYESQIIKAKSAKQFILTNKNEIIQTKKIINLLS